MMSLICYVYMALCVIGLFSGLIVVSAMNPVHRVALLIVVYLIGSFLFMIVDYYFLGLTYIIVYVGAIAILFLFVIMMVDLGPAVTDQNYRSGGTNIAILRGLLSVGLLTFLILFTLLVISPIFSSNSTDWFISSYFEPNSLVTYFYPSWACDYKSPTDIQNLAYVVYIAYPLALYLIGVILWAVMIGIIAITTT